LKEAARRTGSETLVVLGDLFDGVRPEPQLLAAVGDALRHSHVDAQAHLLVGNHDQCSTADGDHALGPLADRAGISVEENDHVKQVSPRAYCGFASFRPGAASVWLPEVAASLNWPNMPRLLALHMGIVDKDTPPWLRDSPGAVDVELLRYLMAQYDIRAVFAGDWHRRKVWEFDDGGKRRTIMQVGTLCPTGFDDAGPYGYGTLAWYEEDSDTVGWEEIPGPRFVVLHGWPFDHKELAKEAVGGCTEYVRAIVPPEHMAAAREFLSRHNYFPGGFEVLPDQVEAQVAARTAATLARSAETLDQALAEYVGAMELPEGVDRNEVLGAALRHMQEAT
jgi:hypothetical protein